MPTLQNTLSNRSAIASTPSKAVATLAEELGRALRSLELIEHGRVLLVRSDGIPDEGETSVKRGYLSLLQSRNSIRELGAAVRAEASPASVSRVDERR